MVTPADTAGPIGDASARQRRPIPRREIVLDSALVAVVAAARIGIEVLSGLQHAAMDLRSFFMPLFHWWWLRPRWLAGWNPWVFGGYPANADPQLGQFHPFGLLFAAFDPLTAITIDGAVSPALAAIGMLVYLRVIGCNRTASLVGSMSYALGGFIVSHAPHPGLLRSALALPWALAAIEALTGRALVVGFGLAVAAILLSGHPQVEAYALVLVVTYAIWLGRPLEGRRGILLLAGLLLGIGVSAAALIPATELISLSTRARATLPFTVNLQLAPRFLPTLVVPFFAGGSVGPLYGWFKQDRFYVARELAGYPGLIPWLAVLSGLPLLVRDRRARFWLGVAVVSTAFVTGIAGVVVPEQGVRAPGRMIMWWNLAFGAGAAIAIDRAMALRTPGERRRLAVRLSVAVAALAAVVVWSVAQGAPAGRAARGSAAVLIVSALAMAACYLRTTPAAQRWMIAVAGADLITFGGSLIFPIKLADYWTEEAQLHVLSMVARSVSSRQDPFPRSLVFPFMPMANQATKERTEVLQGYNPLVLWNLSALLGEGLEDRTRYSVIADLGRVLDPNLVKPRSHVLDLLRCRVIAIADSRYEPLLPPITSLVESDPERWERRSTGGWFTDWAFYINRRALPVGWLVYRIRVVRPEEALNLIRGISPASFSPTEEALVSEPIPELAPGVGEEQNRVGRDAFPPEVNVTAYEEDEIRLVAAPARDALLVTSELAYPGWQAFVDGRPVPVRTVNTAFRAVVLSAGKHEITFRYAPTIARIGLAISGMSIFILIVLTPLPRREATRPRPGSGETPRA